MGVPIPMSDAHAANRKRRLLILRQTGAHAAAVKQPDGADVPEPTEAERFQRACGGTGLLRLAVRRRDEPSSVEEIALERPYLLIGTAESCDVRLPSDSVSRRHAYVQLLNQRVYCFDLGSRTGVYWGDQQRTSGFLEANDAVGIGPFQVRLAENEFEEPWDSGGADGWEAASGSSYSLLFRNASPKMAPWWVRGDVTLIGRHPACKVQLNHPSVALFHASLVRTPSGLWVVDLQSRAGTSLDGERIEFAELQPDDELTIGKFRIQVASMEAVAAPRAELPLVSRPPVASIAAVPERPSNAALPTAEVIRTYPVPTEAAPERQLLAPVYETDQEALFSGTFVRELVQEFARLQQQVLDRARQDVTTVAEQIAAAHQQQLEPLREELTQVRRMLQTLTEQTGRDHAQPTVATVPLAEPPSTPLLSAGEQDSPTAAPPERLATNKARPQSAAAAPAQAETNQPVGGQPPSQPPHKVDLKAWSSDQLDAMQQELDRVLKQLDAKLADPPRQGQALRSAIRHETADDS